MTPLQKVAMGLLIVVLHAPVHGWDLLADPVGWLLVGLGVAALGGSLSRLLLGVAVLAGAVSVVLFLPAVDRELAPSAQWALSLPELGFGYLLCTELAGLAGPAEPVSTWFGLLRWVFVALALAPVLVYGGGLAALAAPAALLAIVAICWLVYLLLRISKRPYALP